MSAPDGVRLLYRLARLYGIQTAYFDSSHHRIQASPESLLLALKALGALLDNIKDVPGALRERLQALYKRGIEPVVVIWEGKRTEIELHMPADMAAGRINCLLQLEGGSTCSWSLNLTDLPVCSGFEIEHTLYLTKRIAIPCSLPFGYHQLTLETQHRLFKAFIICAPLKAYTPTKVGAGHNSRLWGVFTPLYALHSKRSWGAGDFSDLDVLTEWVGKLGGGVVATLPFLASFLDKPFEPSPYTPASRLFWNEFYIDVKRVPEVNLYPEVLELLDSINVQKEIEKLRSLPLVDYRRLMALKREILEEVSRCFFAGKSDRQDIFWRFIRLHPEVEDYACFRATAEQAGAYWQEWPQPLRDGVLKPGDYDEEIKLYYLYAQWLASEQVQSLAEKARNRDSILYLDLPLGVHRYSYDVWREREIFVADVSGGAPPDAVFTTGQNWEFPPLHPEKIREQGYRYYIACLRHNLQHASLLRIDHLMGLHRLFWIPKGLEPSQGVYVRYHAEEFYAILSLESHRYKSCIVGENLGMVPYYINPAMKRHNILSMYVLQYELISEPHKALRSPPVNSVASLNTHDMPLLTAFWQNHDIKERLRLGLLDSAVAVTEQKMRQRLKRALLSFMKKKCLLPEGESDDIQAILRACLAYLSASPAKVVLISLEDLWQETHLQNIPGTSEEYPNWQYKAKYDLEIFCQLSRVIGILQQVNHLRKCAESCDGTKRKR